MIQMAHLGELTSYCRDMETPGNNRSESNSLDTLSDVLHVFCRSHRGIQRTLDILAYVALTAPAHGSYR